MLDLPAPTGPMLRPTEAAEYLGLSKAEFYREMARGNIPRPVRMGVKIAAHPRGWLDAVIHQKAAGGAK